MKRGRPHDHATARELHYGLHPLVDLLFVETNPAPLKYVLHQRGLISSAHVREPLTALTPQGTLRVEELLSEGSGLLA